MLDAMGGKELCADLVSVRKAMIDDKKMKMLLRYCASDITARPAKSSTQCKTHKQNYGK